MHPGSLITDSQHHYFSMPSLFNFNASGDLLCADNLCQQLDPHQDQLNIGPDLDPNCLTL